MDGSRRSTRVPKPKWDTNCINPEDVPIPKCAEDDIPPEKQTKKRQTEEGDWSAGGGQPRGRPKLAANGSEDAPQGPPRQYVSKAPINPPSKKQPPASTSDGRVTYGRPLQGWMDPKLQSAMSSFVTQLFRSSGSGWQTAFGVSEANRRQAAELVVKLKPAAGPVCDVLDRCLYKSLPQLLVDVQLICSAAADRICSTLPPTATPMDAEAVRRDANWLCEQSQAVLRSTEAALMSGRAAITPLPESMATNADPYFQGDWRTIPFSRRPYARLTDYQIIDEGLEAEVAELAIKMYTSVPEPGTQGCDGTCCALRSDLGRFNLLHGKFLGSCPCLNNSAECSDACACAKRGGCLNSAVARRRTLVVGVHVKEVDVWGMDCYTRKNVYNAVAEAGLLKEAPDGAMAAFTERVLLPAINRLGDYGWDIKRALLEAHRAARESGDAWSAAAAAAISARVTESSRTYFRLHPKGCGIVCATPAGLPAQTFVEEYFGECHPPWRWFEKQDALKVRRRAGELPDFYNITLERPKEDPGGYDIIFVDAAPAGSFASRLSHSCTPNCQAVILNARGRLTISVFTLRWIAPGEELTFDYSSVTESDAEYRAAVCLCGTYGCRGSFLYWVGATSFQQVMASQHTFLDRNAIICRAALEPDLTPADEALLDRYSIRGSALGGWGGLLPAVPWLTKWAALILQFVEFEKKELAQVLMRDPALMYSEEVANEQARGVAENRLQNLVISLDKVKHFLRQPGQPQGPPLRLLSAAETAAFLWSGANSVAQRLAATSASHLCSLCNKAGLADHQTPGCAALAKLQALLVVRAGEASDDALARQRLLEMERVLRGADPTKGTAGGRHAAAADLCRFYGATRYFFTPENYRTFQSVPVTLQADEVGGSAGEDDYGEAAAHAGMPEALRAAAAADAAPGAADDEWWSAAAQAAGPGVPWASRGPRGLVSANDAAICASPRSLLSPPPETAARDARGELVSAIERMSEVTTTAANAMYSACTWPPPRSRLAPRGVPSQKVPRVTDFSAAARGAAAGAADGPAAGGAGEAWPGAASGAASEAARPAERAKPAALSSELQDVKKYRAAFVWGQLAGWFKQTVLDPTASLSADRRGTLSLPDVECCYGRYAEKERRAHLNHLETSPSNMWPTGTLWAFKNQEKIYGSPLLDEAIAHGRGEPPRLPALIAELSAMTYRSSGPARAAPEAASEGSAGERDAGDAEEALAADGGVASGKGEQDGDVREAAMAMVQAPPIVGDIAPEAGSDRVL